MKRIIYLIATLFLACGCYEKYVLDYDFDATYIAYQYNLRSFVVGEGMEFEIGAMLSGVIDNRSDRTVNLVIDNSLVNGDLSRYAGSADSFTAFDVMSGNSTNGAVSNSYVKDAILASGISQLTPLPAQMYKTGPLSLTIPKGKHTATVKVKADSLALISDPNAGYNPYYAIGYRIASANVDTILVSKCFSIVAVRLESRFFGNWYHGGESKVVNDGSGQVVSTQQYYTQIPSAEGVPGLYSLTTTGAMTAKTNWFHNDEGSMSIEWKGGSKIEVSDAENKITDMGSSWNEDILLQGRKLYLNYKYSNGDGTSTVVEDTLTFRNRIRDGVNEYQDSNPEHYK